MCRAWSHVPRLVYFSSSSGNTHRFVEALGHEALRLPLMTRDETPALDVPYVLITPTYGAGGPGSVPKQVQKFLNQQGNADLLRGVIGTGNTNFGADYCRAAAVVSRRFGVPVLYKLEIFGTPDDLLAVHNGLDTFWTTQ